MLKLRHLIVLLTIGGLSFLSLQARKKEILTPEDDLTRFVFAKNKDGYRTDALVIMHHDQIIYEKYDRGYNKDTRHYAWSISKTITGALIGAAVQKGDLKIDDPIEQYLGPLGYQEYFDRNPDKQKMTVGDLMDWGSGFEYSEEYEQADSRTDSSVIQQLYSRKSTKDSLQYLLAHEVTDTPGTRFRYTTGDSTLLMGVLKGVYQNNQKNFPWDLLFDKIGMNHTTFETDDAGTFVGGAFAYLTARDMLKFGKLFLNNGSHNGEQILPADWADYSWSISDTYHKTDPSKLSPESQMPGRQWWLNRTYKDPSKPAFPQGPIDAHMGLGHWGQYLIVIPSMNLVAIRFGEDKNGYMNRGQLLEFMLRFVETR